VIAIANYLAHGCSMHKEVRIAVWVVGVNSPTPRRFSDVTSNRGLRHFLHELHPTLDKLAPVVSVKQ
jgi:hypothetical protein